MKSIEEKMVTDPEYKFEPVNSFGAFTPFVKSEAMFAAKKKGHQKMKLAHALKVDWLRHSRGIAEQAYENSENHCVAYQLAHVFLIQQLTAQQKSWEQAREKLVLMP